MDMENVMLKCSAWYLYYYFNNNELIFEMQNLIASKHGTFPAPFFNLRRLHNLFCFNQNKSITIPCMSQNIHVMAQLNRQELLRLCFMLKLHCTGHSKHVFSEWRKSCIYFEITNCTDCVFRRSALNSSVGLSRDKCSFSGKRSYVTRNNFLWHGFTFTLE